mmetsp:Transcript_14007/g.23203  ORF Transcript_14007/g.23203 Transcript_14007/m.23203 type:complete len:244 (-) Transcript_14007:185-916(-)
MRLTADVLLRADNYLNAVQERELCLRGFKIPAIENLGVVQDQYDTIDFTDNEIRILDNFPKMQRLSTILISNNYLFRIGSSLGANLPNITTLVMNNNRLSSLSEIDHLAGFTKLELLSLGDNPITEKPHYRLYAIHQIPSLKMLDFQKVKQQEREAAQALFSTAEGAHVVSSVSEEAKQLSAQQDAAENGGKAQLSAEQKAEISRAIEAATTKEQMDLIERQLRTGTYVFREAMSSGASMEVS